MMLSIVPEGLGERGGAGALQSVLESWWRIGPWKKRPVRKMVGGHGGNKGSLVDLVGLPRVVGSGMVEMLVSDFQVRTACRDVVEACPPFLLHRSPSFHYSELPDSLQEGGPGLGHRKTFAASAMALCSWKLEQHLHCLIHSSNIY